MPEPRKVEVDVALTLEVLRMLSWTNSWRMRCWCREPEFNGADLRATHGRACRAADELFNSLLEKRNAANGPEVGGVHCKMCAREVCGKRCPGIVAPSREAVLALCEATGVLHNHSGNLRALDANDAAGIETARSMVQDALARVRKEMGP